MPPSNAEDEPLGTKHKELNKLVHDAVVKKSALPENIFVEDKHDLNNLMKIDIASHNKDIDYIISVLKSEDMLYVSRAIKKSTWLVEDQYAHIINPEYLNDHLFPHMKTKTSIKLLKHIRHYLKTESRVEEFYKSEKNPKVAVKWLSRCSITFIEANVSKHMNYITNLEFKRLCERSISIFEVAVKNYWDTNKLQAASFFLRTHADKYLDLSENEKGYNYLTFGAAATELIMKNTPDRIMNNFTKYCNRIHLPTFVKYIRRDEIKDFLFKQLNRDEKSDEHYHNLVFNFEIAKVFVERMPKEEQFEFVKKVFLDKDNILKLEDDSLQRGTDMFAIKRICLMVCTPTYHWYKFAPFNIAFEEIKKLLQSQQVKMDKREQNSILNILLDCAGKNAKDVLAVLKYYNKYSSNDATGQKRGFIDNLLSRIEIYINDNDTWDEIIEIVNNMTVYTDNDNRYAEIITVKHLLQNKQVPEKYKKNISITTFKKYHNTLKQDEQNKIFVYLYDYITKKIESHDIQDKTEFEKAVQTVNQLLVLLLDWGKKLSDYPFALNKIKDLVRIRKENSWNVDLSILYTKKKSWKRLMFEESINMNPSQIVCVNALKHDPELLVRYKSEVETLCCDDKISLKQLLRKLRIFWPESLGNSWAEFYLSRLDKLGGQKALTCGLFTLLPRDPVLDIIKRYAPAQPKIDWNKTDELTLGLQRCIAKNMHIARPQPSADAILLYAKGDFLQFALPSLLAIYYNMGCIQSEEHVPKLLNTPVSLQKHGLRFAFIKLKHEELKRHLSNIWKTSKNISIRAVSFVLLFDSMCKENDVGRSEELWEILEVFMDNLSYKEDKKIYELLPKVRDVPDTIKPKFLIKSYNFLKNLLPHLKNDSNTYEYHLEQLAVYIREIMEFISPEFVSDIITEYLDKNMFNGEVHSLNDGMVGVITSYLLCAKDEETQNNRYEKTFLPVIKRALDQWNDTHNERYFIKQHFQQILTQFSSDLNEYVINKGMIIPIKMFTDIQNQLKPLSVPQNYIMLTSWKLIVKLTEIIEKDEKRESWLAICTEMVPEYGKYCLEVLKEDVKLYFPCIYILYAKVLNITFNRLIPDIVRLQIYEVLLSDKDFIPAFLVALNVFFSGGRNYYQGDDDDECTKKENEIQQIIREHPTVEVKMHYYHTFKDEAENKIVAF